MSRSIIVPLLAGVALIAVIFAGIVTGFSLTGARQSGALAQAETPTATPAQATAAPTAPGRAAAAAQRLPPELAFLAQLTPQQRFDHMLPGQAAFLNPQGQEVLVNFTPGQVSSTSSNTVSITVNGPAPAQIRTFNVTQTTWVHAMPPRGSLQAVATGDRVVVYSIGNSSDATAIIVSPVSRTGVGRFGGGFHLMGDGA
jgi:hypothetical protein